MTEKNPNCRSGCPSQDHESYKDCLQDMRIGITKGESAPASYS